MNLNNKIVIGTANFSQSYGFEKRKFSNINEIPKIISRLTKVTKKKVFFDTSQAYGSSELIMGKYNRKKKLKYITKISFNKKEKINFNLIKKKVLRSLDNLKIQKLYCLLLHNTEILKNKKKLKVISEGFDKLKEEKYILKKGISIYTINELNEFYKSFKPDVIQIPLNVFDQRFVQSKWANKLKKDKKEIHARSVFLQGLLLKNQNKIPKKFLKFSAEFKKWFVWLKKNNISNLNACLNFVYNQKIAAKVVVGLENYNQLSQILKFKKDKKNLNFKKLACNKKKLIDPRKWS